MDDAKFNKRPGPDKPDELEPDKMIEIVENMIISGNHVSIKRGDGRWQKAKLGMLRRSEFAVQVIWPHDSKPEKFQHKDVDISDLLRWQKVKKVEDMINGRDTVLIKRDSGKWQEAKLRELLSDDVVHAEWPNPDKPKEFQYKPVEIDELFRWQEEAREEKGLGAEIAVLRGKTGEIVSGGKDEDGSGE